MASQFPSVVATITDPQPTDRLNSPSHSGLHQTENAEIEQTQRFIGTLPASAVGTLLYDVRSPASSGGGHIQAANTGGTGQTSFNKGDLLVGQSSSILTKLAVGADNAVLVADSSQAAGVKWGGVPGQNVQSFIATGVWVKPTTATVSSRVLVELWGSGGSGAAAITSDEAGGGGGGGYVSAWYTASMLASSVLIGVAPGGNSVGPNAIGAQGGATVFDPVTSLLTAFGGGAGGLNGTGAAGGGGAGTTSTGSAAVGNTPGVSGGFLGGIGGVSNNPGQTASFMGAIAGGGGGGGDGASGGGAILGGGGGGGTRASVLGAGGVSKGGGSGSAGSVITSGSVLAGSTPGGGGGAAYGNGSSGQGGSGKAIITTFT